MRVHDPIPYITKTTNVLPSHKCMREKEYPFGMFQYAHYVFIIFISQIFLKKDNLNFEKMLLPSAAQTKKALTFTKVYTLFVLSIYDPKQNARSLFTPVSDTVFYPLSLGSLHFVLHGSFNNRLVQRL